MRNAELVESVRALVDKDLVRVYSLRSPPSGAGVGRVFFDDIPPEALRERGKKIEEGTGAAEWFLVTSRPRGLEWKEDMLDRYGVWVVEVDDIRPIRAELELIASEREHHELQATLERLLKRAERWHEKLRRARESVPSKEDVEDEAVAAEAARYLVSHR